MNLATKECVVSEPTSITKKYEFVEGDEKVVAPGIVDSILGNGCI